MPEQEMFPLRCSGVHCAEWNLPEVAALRALRSESFRIPYDLHIAVEAIAARERSSVSAIIRRAIVFEVERQRRTRRRSQKADPVGCRA